MAHGMNTSGLDESGTKPDPWPQIASLASGVGRQIKFLRKAQGMTLEDLSGKSGVSTGLISQVERGKGNPSFNGLVRIAHALSTPIAQLLQADRDQSPVVRRHQRRSLDVNTGSEEPHVQALHELLTPGLDQLIEAIWIEAPPGYTTQGNPFTHAGEEFGLVLAGVHEVHVGNACYELEAGDSISYASTIPHWYRNPGPDPVKAVWVITPPSF